MIQEKSILKLTKNILKRYEHNLNNGILFLYDVETDDIWAGNESSNDLLKFIDGKSTLKEIYLNLLPIFNEYDYDELKDSFDSLLEELIKKGFLEYV